MLGSIGFFLEFFVPRSQTESRKDNLYSYILTHCIVPNEISKARSLIVKSHQNIIELITRPGIIKSMINESDCCYFAGTMGPLSSSRNLMLSLTIVLSTCATLLVSGQRASTCDSRACQLPNCFCGGINIPGNLTKEEIPQLVLLTFDDAVNGLNKEFFSKLFDERYNPNGCPIKVSSQ